jgi:hypothetical protein
MTDNGELHVVFGTGAVGMSVMDELVQRSPDGQPQRQGERARGRGGRRR